MLLAAHSREHENAYPAAPLDGILAMPTHTCSDVICSWSMSIPGEAAVEASGTCCTATLLGSVLLADVAIFAASWAGSCAAAAAEGAAVC